MRDRVRNQKVVGAAAVVVLVAGAAAGQESVELLKAGGSTLLHQTSYTGSCYETLGDISINVYLQLANGGKSLQISDMDGDGAFTAMDTIAAIEAVIRTSMADANASGSLEADDVAVAAELLMSTTDLAQADFDGDGDVSVMDLVNVIDRVSKSDGAKLLSDDQVHQVALDIYSELSFAAPAIESGQISLASATAAGCGSGNPHNWPVPRPHGTIASYMGDPRWNDQPHLTTVSTKYPEDHMGALSRAFPPNHLYTITKDWPADWTNPTDPQLPPQGPWPDNHEQKYSDTWWERPEGHKSAYSKLWQDHPNHTYDVSKAWPGDHAKDKSAQWPPNHSAEHSATHQWPNPSDHLKSISDSWGPTHATTVSGQWPPNHVELASGTWAPSHYADMSVAWPPSHSSYVSGSWPDHLYPGHWPPNHNGATSKSWDEGTPPPTYDPGQWPNPHDYVPSALLEPPKKK
jgi:hypothetical protein